MSRDEKRPLGRILLQRKLVSQAQLDQALDEQKGQFPKKPLMSQLTEKGVVEELAALRVLSEQHGVPGIDLGQIVILLEHLDTVPREIAEKHDLLPVLVKDDRLFVAMVEPNQSRTIDEVEFVTGKKVYPYVALTTTLRGTLAQAYGAKERGERYFVAPRAPSEMLAQLGLDPTSRAPASPQATPSEPPEPPPVFESEAPDVSDEIILDAAEFGDAPDSVIPPRAESLSSGTVAKKVLVVDDEEDIRKLLRRLLREKGFEVLEAERGGIALRMVKEHNPDLIVLDAMLPELHGFEIARRLKGSAKYGQIPVIMVSAIYKGWRIAEDLKTNYGIQEYLEKPFRMADLLAAISRAMSTAEHVKVPQKDPDALNREAEEALRKGIEAYREGRIDEAQACLKQGVEIDPLSYRLRYHLALLFGKNGQVYEAIQELERAVVLNPKHFPALKNLAVLYEKAGFRNKAVEMWERCVQAAPDDATRASAKGQLLKLL